MDLRMPKASLAAFIAVLTFSLAAVVRLETTVRCWKT